MSVDLGQSKRMPKVILVDRPATTAVSCGNNLLQLKFKVWDTHNHVERAVLVTLDDGDLYAIKCAIVSHADGLARRAARVAVMPTVEEAKAARR